jgi:hypothetical protein
VSGLAAEIEERHRRAVREGRDTYIDPMSGYAVFTALSHTKRGHCCKSGCRHCPYGFQLERRGRSTRRS